MNGKYECTKSQNYSREMVTGHRSWCWRRRRVHGGRRARVAGTRGRGAGGGRARRRWYRGGLIVLGGKSAFVQHMLGVVRLRCRLDVHEGDCGTNTTNCTGTRGRTRARALRSTQQLDILDSAISVKVKAM